MVDPEIRLQNISLEHGELTARRAMSWAESTNRTTMFMTVVGAAAVALALFAQTGVTGASMALLAVIICSVVLLVGLTTLLRVAQLDEEDMRWIQGLNRLRSLRLELDPGLAPYLVTSQYDDFASVLEAYTTEHASRAYAFGTLVVLLVGVNAVLVGFVGGLAAVSLGGDLTAAVLVAALAATGFLVATSIWMYRGVRQMPGRLVSLIPASRPVTERTPDGGGAGAPGASVATDPTPRASSTE